MLRETLREMANYRQAVEIIPAPAHPAKIKPRFSEQKLISFYNLTARVLIAGRVDFIWVRDNDYAAFSMED
jgi:hypothetical protein